jgi:ATP-dependent Zn protease
MSETASRDGIDGGGARMGPLELAVYRKDWKSSRTYRRHAAAVAARRELEAAVKAAQDEIMKAGGVRGAASAAKSTRSSFDRMRATTAMAHDHDDEAVERDVEAPTPGRVAARLLLARLFDQQPALREEFRASSPVVLIEVPDRLMLARVTHQWRDALGLESLRFADVAKMSDSTKREDYDALHLIVQNRVAVNERLAADGRAFTAVQLALPLLAICPQVAGHVSKVLTDAATHRLTLPQIDASLIARVVAVVTGRRCRKVLPVESVRQVGLHELLLAVRFDRTPDECFAALERLVQAKSSKKESRDLTLDQLHGLDEAVAWAKSLIVDIEAWKRGEIGWDALDAGVLLHGPSGTGKTTFAFTVARAAGLNLVTSTLAQWQGSGEGHLGHLLRAMRKDFDDARAKAPCIMFIDEIDSFPSRESITHAYKDYVTEVVNAFIEQLDGLSGRQGLIFIGATNNVARCDPAIVRSGRLNRIIRIQMPGMDDLEKMLRVRLGSDLQGDDLSEICLLALGSTGADVERIVKDARRLARHADRALAVNDLRSVLTTEDDRPEMERWRTAVHEAAHIVTDVLLFGPDDVHATLANSRERGGAVIRTRKPVIEGTYGDYHKRLQVLLAGRTGEELLLGAPSHGAGGSQGSDLERATAIAAAMVGSLGLAGKSPLLYFGRHDDVGELMTYSEVRAGVNDELLKAAAACRKLLEQHRGTLELIAQLLRSRGRIDGHEVDALLESSERTVERRGP